MGLLDQYSVSHFVVGHTILSEMRITARFGARVFLIDTGMLSSHYQGGRASALEIEDDRITAVYLDERILPCGPGNHTVAVAPCTETQPSGRAVDPGCSRSRCSSAARRWPCRSLGRPIKYTLRFPAPHTHYVEVEAVVPTGGQPQVELMMAVWTPGSYLVREYARNVEGVSAQTPDHQPLRVDKSRKNRWRVQTGGAPTVLVAYRVYAREMSVRTNWVEDGFALLNGAPTFLTLVETTTRPHEVRLVLPPTWSTTMTSLPAVSEGEAHTYLAADFDTLVDSPIVTGNPAVYEFDLDGTPHYLVNVDEGGVWDGPRSAKDVETIVGEHRRMWGFLPYDRYLFLNMITEAGGALEHRNSTVLMTSRWRAGTSRGYLGWLNTVSHEYFHAWNAKRLRPVELGPFDYESEVYTKSLWIVEGLTEYYSDLALHRAGLSTQVQYLASLSGQIGQLQTTPGRLVQPIEQASYDAWIEYYRPDENSPNTAVSYYTKGAVLGFLLDARIRKATAGAKSLDNVMRLAYQRYAGDRGFTPEQFRATAEEVAGRDLSAWFVTVLETTAELDYTEALDWFGLELTGAPTEHGQRVAGTRHPGGRRPVARLAGPSRDTRVRSRL